MLLQSVFLEENNNQGHLEAGQHETGSVSFQYVPREKHGVFCWHRKNLLNIVGSKLNIWIVSWFEMCILDLIRLFYVLLKLSNLFSAGIDSVLSLSFPSPPPRELNSDHQVWEKAPQST